MIDPNSLDQVLRKHGIELTEKQSALLERYCKQLWQWNEKLNLTRHLDFEKFVTRDVTDSLALADIIEPNEEILDIGTGGGVPGIVVAILRPDLHVTLCESVRKKANAVDAIVDSLGLPISTNHARAENLLDDFRYHSLVARAVGPMAKMLQWFEPHWASFDRLLLVKGPRWTEERAEARQRGLFNNLQLRVRATYGMSGTSSESVILEIRPNRNGHTDPQC